ncbi:MAG: energy-coupling factor transporter transmembrane component T [Acutalibacteraceae bacterium]|nr:energy-coupling factor transporter transmembrane component T [Acutalibacteraceae bacterium]
MISDITFGQYLPCDSVIHKTDPRVKFLLLIFIIVFIFLSTTALSMALSIAFVAVIIAVSKIPFTLYLKNLKAILPILIFTAVINSLYVKEGAVLLDWWIINITTGGIYRAVLMALRITLLIFVSASLTYTTTPNDLTDAIERLCLPLKFIGLSTVVHILTMMMTIALRFIPTLIEETQKIINAQKARGADIESGGLISKIKALTPILIPLIILSVRRAYDLAEAMECRCYNGGVGKQRMKQLKIHKRDIAVCAVSVFWAGLIILTIFFGDYYATLFAENIF